ncbi:hypothetical protein FB446DRAFT_787035 [Lentinula raphanica]|nr:hypothetical protein FB446DRAFT_787035 [Lentinula raphanica]
MGGSTNSLDSLSSPSPSPPPMNKAEGSVSKLTSTKQKPTEPAAGLDSDSELSELTEEEQDEKQKHKLKQKKFELNSLNPDASSSGVRRGGAGFPVRGGPRRGGRRKRGTLVPAPMWGWAMYPTAQDADTGPADDVEDEDQDETSNVHISPTPISAPNPLDVLTSAALDADDAPSPFSRSKPEGQELEGEDKSGDSSEAKGVTVVVGDIDALNSMTAKKHTVLLSNGKSSIASSRAQTPDSIASSRPSPPQLIPLVAPAPVSRITAAPSTTEDEDDNTEPEEEDELVPDEQPKPLIPSKSRSKPNLRIDASAPLPSNVTVFANSHSSSPQLPPLSAGSIKSPITPSNIPVTAANSRSKSSRGGRGRGRGRGRARTRGARANALSDVASVDIVGDPVDSTNIPNDLSLDKDNTMDVDVDGPTDVAPQNTRLASLMKVTTSEDEIMEPEETTVLADANKVVAEPDADISDKSDAEPEPDIELDADPELEVEGELASDASDGEDEKEDEIDDEGEDEKDDPDELEVDEEKEEDDKEEEDKDDEDKEASDKDDGEKDIDDDDHSEVNLEDEEEESDLQPAHRVEALDMLAVIELKFAMLRERLYIEKMEELAWEESLVSSGEHPEMIYIQSELLLRKNKRLELAERKCTFEVANITKRRRLDEDATWSSWKLQKDELQTDMIAENNRKRRKLERNRRSLDRPQPARRIPFPPNSDYLPPAPTLRQVVESFPFSNSDQIIHNFRNSSPRKAQTRKEPQVNGSHRRHIRVDGIVSHGMNTQATSGLSVAYPKLSTLSSSEAQGDLESLLSVTGARRTGSGLASMNSMGVAMNMNVNIGMNMDMNMGINPVYEQGIHGLSTLGVNHVPHGHVYASVSGTTNGPNPIGNRDRFGPGLSSSSTHGGPGPSRQIVPGNLTSPRPAMGPSQPGLSMAHGHESQFAMSAFPVPLQMGGGGSGDSLPPSFGSNRQLGTTGPRPGSGAGLRSVAIGLERDKEMRSVPTGSGGGGRSYHPAQSHHPLSGPPSGANSAFPEVERQPDGSVIMIPSASSSSHGGHARQLSSSSHFGPLGPGVGGDESLTASSRRRSPSPIGPSVGITPNSTKGNVQWMGAGMGMAGFGPAHQPWEEEERERDRIGHRDVRDMRGHERERERDRERDRDQHMAYQQRQSQQEKQQARPQSTGPITNAPPSHVHSHPSQAPHHHHHVRPHHHHIVHHHHGSSAGPHNTSPTGMRGPSLSPRMSRGEMLSERDRENGTSRAMHHHPHPEAVNSRPGQVVAPASSHPLTNRIEDGMPPDYRERERDGRRLSGGRPPSITPSRVTDERERGRDLERLNRDHRAGNMSFATGSNSQTPQHNGLGTSSRPTSWNAVGRDDLYRPESVHSPPNRFPSSNTSSSSPVHPIGAILPVSSTSLPSAAKSPSRTRALPPRAGSPTVVSLVKESPEQHMRSPSRNRELPPLTAPHDPNNSSYDNPGPKIVRGASPPSTPQTIGAVLVPGESRSPIVLEDNVKNGATTKHMVASPLSTLQNPINQKSSDDPLENLAQKRAVVAQVVMEEGQLR